MEDVSLILACVGAVGALSPRGVLQVASPFRFLVLGTVLLLQAAFL